MNIQCGYCHAMLYSGRTVHMYSWNSNGFCSRRCAKAFKYEYNKKLNRGNNTVISMPESKAPLKFKLGDL